MESLAWSWGGKGKVLGRWRNNGGGSCVDIVGEAMSDQCLGGLPEYPPNSMVARLVKAHQPPGHREGVQWVGVEVRATPQVGLQYELGPKTKWSA